MSIEPFQLGKTKKNGYSAHNESVVGEALQKLWKIFPEHSRTFAFTTRRLKECGSEYEADVLMWAYSLCRLLDNISDHKIGSDAEMDDEKKGSLSYIIVNALNSGDAGLAASAVPFMREIPVKKEGYKLLIENAPLLVIAGDAFSDKSRDSILGHLEDMAKGFSNPEIKKINTGEDQIRAYYFDAQKPARMINDLWEEKGHFEHILPAERDQMRKWGDSLAIVLQGVNDYNDWRRDISDGKPKFPLVDVVKKIGGVKTYEELLDENNNDKVLAVLETQRRLVLDHYEPSLKYCENLTPRPIGPRVFCWDALAFATANLRELKKPEKALSSKESKISRKEVYDMDSKVTEIAEQNLSIRPFIEHLMERQSFSYKI